MTPSSPFNSATVAAPVPVTVNTAPTLAVSSSAGSHTPVVIVASLRRVSLPGGR
jgi:hypothetical protein